MTLTIEQVRDCKFHLARRNGYEPVDVDNFVDEVEETLVELTGQIESLKRSATGSGESDAALVRSLTEREAELAQNRAQLEASQGELQRQQGEIERLRNELAAAHQGESQDVAQLRSDLESVRGRAGQLESELENSRRDLEVMREQAAAKDAELEAVKRHNDELRSEAVTGQGQGQVQRLVLASAPEASSAVARLLEMATHQADELVAGAQGEAQRLLGDAKSASERMRNEAESQAEQSRHDASSTAERTLNEARGEANRLVAEAQQRRDVIEVENEQRKASLVQEITERRNQLVGALEQEHGSLAIRVSQLRDFERNYRDSFAGALEHSIENLRSAVFEPADTPDILKNPPAGSNTPRLDALLDNN